MGSHITQVTQKRVSQAVQAFESVHLRQPSIRYLCQMLHAGEQTIMRFERTCSPLERLSRKMVEEAKQLDVPTHLEVNAKKQAGAKKPRARMREAQLQAAIDRVVSKAESSVATVDFIHETGYVRNGRVRVTRIG
jgi:hypothetical protein